MMPAPKKIVSPKNCQKCSKPFNNSNPHETLCAKCRKSLPRCGACRAIMAPEFGYLESFAREVGKYKICSGCNYELRRKGYLPISASQYLYPSGKVKTRAVRAEDKV